MRKGKVEGWRNSDKRWSDGDSGEACDLEIVVGRVGREGVEME